MTDKALPCPPAGTRAGGRRLWRSVLADYELDEHELVLLREAVRQVDALDALDRVVRRDGPMKGARVHPAVVEARQARIALARVVAALRLPDGAEGDHSAGRRLQRRTGARGVYSINMAGRAS